MKAECTWGFGPDVVLSLDGSELVLSELPYDKTRWIYGVVSKGSLDLTATQAEELAEQLLLAAKRVRELESMCEEHDGNNQTA